MNALGYALGTLLLIKWFIRNHLGHKPARWLEKSSSLATGFFKSNRLVSGLAVLTTTILAYCLIAALNARAVYDPVRLDFNYQEHLSWLPHSYDRGRTLQIFANYLALACWFWGVRDWLLGKTPSETRAARTEPTDHRTPSQLPARLRRLLWVLCINGMVLAVEAIWQRLDGGGKLLWLVQPRINQEAVHQFGPYAYRANGAQFFNLVWPVALGFWWTLRRELRHQRSSKMGGWRSHLLLPGVLLMAACPIISSSRMGALVSVGAMLVAMALLLFGLRRRSAALRFGVVLFFVAILATAASLGWDTLQERLESSEKGLQGREEIFDTARNIARDYPLFGTGPGTFEPVFQLYRSSTDEYWPAQLHNDWLETLITFGWLGSVFIGLAFACVLVRWFLPGELHVSWRLTAFLWLALGGCLAHARYDFPLQVYSLLHLFLLLCAILFVVSRRQPAIP